jgi:hypothetical protein
MAFIFSLVWSIGVTFYEKNHDGFDLGIRKVKLLYRYSQK